MNPLTPSSPPVATADPDAMQRRWKNRMLTAMRTAAVGMTRFASQPASRSPYIGPSARGTGDHPVPSRLG